jgi:hypothetical protein
MYLYIDMTDVLNRGLFQALYAAPSLINVFVTPLVGAALADSGNWR